MFTPVGLYYCFKKPTNTKIFAAIYVVLAVYFASVMVRLLLVLAPAVSVMAGIGVSSTVRFFVKSIRGFKHPEHVTKTQFPIEKLIFFLLVEQESCSNRSFPSWSCLHHLLRLHLHLPLCRIRC
mgnify:CR=1 FL=1